MSHQLKYKKVRKKVRTTTVVMKKGAKIGALALSAHKNHQKNITCLLFKYPGKMFTKNKKKLENLKGQKCLFKMELNVVTCQTHGGVSLGTKISRDVR
jgi:hypothetical protein